VLKYKFTILVVMNSILLVSCGGSEDQNYKFRIYKEELKYDISNALRTKYYYYDDVGRITKTVEDAYSDGRVYHVETYLYKNGLLFEIIKDREDDGFIEEVSTYYYGSDSLLEKISNNHPNGHSTDYYSLPVYGAGDRITHIENYSKEGYLLTNNRYYFNSENLLNKIDFSVGIVSVYSYNRGQDGKIESIISDNDTLSGMDYVKKLYYEEGPCVLPEIRSINTYHCSY